MNVYTLAQDIIIGHEPTDEQTVQLVEAYHECLLSCEEDSYYMSLDLDTLSNYQIAEVVKELYAI